MTCLCPTEIAAIVEGIGPQHRTLWRSWGNWSLIFPGLGEIECQAVSHRAHVEGMGTVRDESPKQFAEKACILSRAMEMGCEVRFGQYSLPYECQ